MHSLAYDNSISGKLDYIITQIAEVKRVLNQHVSKQSASATEEVELEDFNVRVNSLDEMTSLEELLSHKQKRSQLVCFA